MGSETGFGTAEAASSRKFLTDTRGAGWGDVTVAEACAGVSVSGRSRTAR